MGSTGAAGAEGLVTSIINDKGFSFSNIFTITLFIRFIESNSFKFQSSLEHKYSSSYSSEGSQSRWATCKMWTLSVLSPLCLATLQSINKVVVETYWLLKYKFRNVQNKLLFTTILTQVSLCLTPTQLMHNLQYKAGIVLLRF